MVRELLLNNCKDMILQPLLSRTWFAAVFDSVASSKVCGTKWLNEHVKILSTDQQSKMKHRFRFGGGRQLQSLKTAKFPATNRERKAEIKTGTIDANIPLLLSAMKPAMKKAQLQSDINTGSIKFMGDKIPFTTRSNGFYSLRLTEPKRLLHKISLANNQDKIALRVTESRTCKEIAQKLHRSFAHPSTRKHKINLKRWTSIVKKQRTSNWDQKDIQRISHMQYIWNTATATCNLSSISIGVSRNSGNGFKHIYWTYHPSPDQSLQASISWYIYSTRKHRNSHKTRILKKDICTWTT